MSRKTDRAKRKLAEATEQVEQWVIREEELSAELAAAEANVGAEALETGDLEGAAERVTRLRDQLGAARRTVEAAEAQRTAAKGDVWLAEADDLDREADELAKQADEHAARTRELLDALREHKGGEYMPSQPPPGVASDRHFWTPRSDQLRNAANAERAEAGRLRRQAEQRPARREPAGAAA